MDFIEKLNLEINKLESTRHFRQALEACQKALKSNPGNRKVAVMLAQRLLKCKEYHQAFILFDRLFQDSLRSKTPIEFEVTLGLAQSALKNSKIEIATQVLDKLLKSNGNNQDVLSGYASTLRLSKKFDLAEEYISRSLKINPSHQESIFEQSQLLIEKEKFDDAIKLLEKNIRCAHVHGDSIDLWMSTLDKLERNRYCQDTLEELSKQFPLVIEFIYGFAVLANRAGEITLARPAFMKALELSPNNFRIYYELGVLERVAGNLDVSMELIGKALDLFPDNPAALRTFGSDLKYEYGDNNYKRLNYVAAKFSEFSPIEQIHLHYALAKAQEDVGELDAAFRHYQVGGAKKRQIEEYNEKESLKLVQLIPKIVTKKNIDLAKDVGNESAVPVFILGMPRSGTSLMEQILSAHPDIFGAGELKFLTGVLENIGIGENKGIRLRMGNKDPVFEYELNASWNDRGAKFVEKLEKLAGDKSYKRIIDKMPGNFNFVGLIHTILPKAKIIHSRRHPVETCLSIYRIHFAEGHQWSYNLRELGRYYKRYCEVMK